MIFPLLLDYQKPDKRYLEELLTVLNLKDRRNHYPVSFRRSTAESGDWPRIDYPSFSDSGRRANRKFGLTKQQ